MYPIKKNFLQNNFGAVSSMAVISLTLTIFFISVLVEYGLILKKKGELQDSVDVTNSWLVSHYLNLQLEGKKINQQEIRDLAFKHFKMNIRLTPKEEDDFSIVFPTFEKKSLKITASIFYTPILLNLLDEFLSRQFKEKYRLTASADSLLSSGGGFGRGQKVVEIAFVVDLSGTPLSVAKEVRDDGNIFEFKKQLKELLQLIRNNMGEVKVGIVPFATFVRPVAFWDATHTWLDMYARSPKHWSHFDFPPSENGVIRIFPDDPDRVFVAKKPAGYDSVYHNYLEYRKKGPWDSLGEGTLLTRYSLMRDMIYKEARHKENSILWQGCVEAPLYPYNVTDNLMSHIGGSMFVPTFYPDHPFEDSQFLMIDYWPDTYGKNPLYPWNHKFKYYLDHNIEPWGEEHKAKSIKYHGKDAETKDYLQLTKHNLLFNDIRKYFIYNDREDFSISGSMDKIDFGHHNKILRTKGPNTYCHNFTVVPLTNISKPKKDISKLDIFAKDYDRLRDSIDKFEYTRTHANITEGLAWGWRVLSKDRPFEEGLPYNTPGNTKFIILFTQGRNRFNMVPGGASFVPGATVNPIFPEATKYKEIFDYFYTKAYKDFYRNDYFWYYSAYNAYGYGNYAMQQLKDSFEIRQNFLKKKNLQKSPNDFIPSQRFGYVSEMNNQTQEVCRNMKDKNIKIITVVVGQQQSDRNKNTTGKDIIKSCASSWPTFKIKDLEPPDHNKLYWDADQYGLEKTIADISSILFNYRIHQ